MRRLLQLLAVLLLCWLPVAAAQQREARLALVVGVSDYARDRAALQAQGFFVPPSLPNAVRDSELIADALRSQGFEVRALANPKRRDLLAAVQQFGADLTAAGPNAVGLFYFAGHGAQGRAALERDVDNYLIPLGAELINEYDLESQAVPLSRISAAVRARDPDQGAVILVLDACRDFPLPPGTTTRSTATTRGLAESNAASGTLIAYATKPGEVANDGAAGSNGPYAVALAKQIRAASGLRLEDVFYQVRREVFAATGSQETWESSSLRRRIMIGAPKVATQAELDTDARALLVSMGYGPDGAVAFRRNVGLPESGVIDSEFVSALRLFKTLQHRAPTTPVSGARIATSPTATVAIDNSAVGATLRLDPGMHTAVIKRINATADGRILVTAGDDKTARVWGLPSGQLLRTLRVPIGPGNEGKIFGLAVDPGGRWAAVGGWLSDTGLRDHITLFDLNTGEVKTRLGPFTDVVHELGVSPDGRYLAAGFSMQGLRVWRTQNGGDSWTETFSDKAYTTSIYGIDFGRSGTAAGRLAATSYDGAIRLYEPSGASFRLVARQTTHDGARPYAAAFSPDGTTLAVGFDDRPQVSLFSAADLSPLPGPDLSGLSSWAGGLNAVAWMASDTGGRPRLVAGGTYASSGGRPLQTWPDGGRGPRDEWSASSSTVFDLVTLPSSTGQALAYAAGDPAIGVLDVVGNRSAYVGPAASDMRAKLDRNLLVSSDGRQVRFGLSVFDRNPVLFDVARRRLDDSPTQPANMIAAVTGGLDIQNWRDQRPPSLNGMPLRIDTFELSRSLSVAPDAKSFILGSEWSLRRFSDAGSQLWTREVPSPVWGVVTTRGGQVAVAAYGDGTIRWHRVSDGKELLALFVHLPDGPTGKREWILFTPDGYFDASSPEAENLIGWHVNRDPGQSADFLPLERFAARFRRPDIVARALDG